MKVAKVVWRDAKLDNNGWVTIDEAVENNYDTVTSVGTLIYEGDDFVALTTSVLNNKCGGVLYIPRGCVQSITYMKEKQ